MQSIKKTVEINAPVQQVFEYATQPMNLTKYWRNMVEVSNARREANGAQEFDWVYKMAGIHFKGHAKTLQARQNDYLEIRNDSGIPSTFKWTFEGRGKTTRITLEVEYTIPTPVIGKLAEVAVASLNERDAETMLANLKVRCEAIAQPAVSAAPHA